MTAVTIAQPSLRHAVALRLQREGGWLRTKNHKQGCLCYFVGRDHDQEHLECHERIRATLNPQ